MGRMDLVTLVRSTTNAQSMHFWQVRSRRATSTRSSSTWSAQIDILVNEASGLNRATVYTEWQNAYVALQSIIVSARELNLLAADGGERVDRRA